MRLTRWKLMAGVLGLSMCGLAALAEPACRTVGLTRRADDPKSEPTEASKPLPLPVPAPPPGTEVPPPIIPTVDDKKPAPLPSPIPTPEVKPADLKPIALPPINDPTAPPVIQSLTEDKGKKDILPAPLPTPLTGPAPIPVSAPTPGGIDPLPKPVEGAPIPTKHAPIPAFAEPVVPVKNEKPAPLPVPPAKDELAPLSKPKADLPPPAPAFAEPIKPAPEPKPAGVVSGKKLKVMLHLSDEKPWFEVKDGDEVVLKVTADAVSLEAAVSGKATSTLTASGAVTFRTLGGFGTCDELRVVPGTGEVVVTGKVAVTSNWGKAETTATADKMTFRLGGDAGKK
jgi:hypothetical protein